MSDPKEIFRQFCKKNAMRYTPEREVIIDEVYRKDTHFDIEQLFSRIRNRYPQLKLAKGSIYRTIPHLIEAGLLRESLTDDGRIRYEHTLGHSHHDHIKCLKCGKIDEFFEKSIDQKQAELCKNLNFEMVSHMHVIYGYCSKCSGKKSS